MWNPVAKVFVNGAEYTSDTIADVSITYGKKDITDAFRASYATVSLVSDGAGLPINLNDNCRITLQNSTATDVTIFTGRVLDIKIEMRAADWIVTSLSLLSPVARLGRRFVGAAGYPHEFDGARITSILTEAGNVVWLEAGGTWADQIGTWNQYEGMIGTIDPGDFELHAYNLDGGFVTELLSIAEQSGLGHLWESTDGHVNYQEASARLDDVTANGYESISSDDVLLSGTAAEISSGFTTNSVQVSTYTGHTETASEYASISTYGRIYETFTTWLRNNIDAATWASTFLARYAYPKPILSSFTIPLSQVTTALRDTLIDMRGGLPVSIPGLPAALAPNPYEGFVEGWQWRIQTGEAFITLNVSDKALSI